MHLRCERVGTGTGLRIVFNRPQHVVGRRKTSENSAVHGGTLETAGSLRERLKFAAVGLLNRGMTPNQVAEVLNLPKSTVVAWLAHETRGSYMGKPVRQQEGPR